ncbi:gamma-glutamyltranspeptidase [Thalassotalea euphylliae]|uniref:Gamma-glutamyltranspeptidase n=1 Tax=Thalassotalea euphylliae TaxID=1655234 RepID=A0A3E0TUM7_9GAMM|nr:gamma-glutamyltransferase [Thalassotalea euphylliae]REL27625.1 gamma-glutamyltranspeptidase [Thalassotalea euphylliae]
MMKENIAFTAPHKTATEAGMSILRQGGTATEAMVAAAATISVVYPHMNSIGGDGFWLIDNPGSEAPIAIDACGAACQNLSVYQGLSAIPERGGLSAITQAGTISGWQAALNADAHAKLPLSEILAPAIAAARTGFEVTTSLQTASNKLFAVAERNNAFKSLYEPRAAALKQGEHFTNVALASTFEHLAQHGLSSFYQGELAASFAADLAASGSPITLADINATQAQVVKPLKAQLQGVDCYNLPAPTQGIHSLLILSIVDRLRNHASEDIDWLHLIVEATKQSFHLRPQLWADPKAVTDLYHQVLEEPAISELANNISMAKAEAWPFNAAPGDTVWLAARDQRGQMVSFIQSIYWEFGAGVVMKDGGFTWNNRGISFSLDSAATNCLAANKKPAHTLNPAFARYHDGRRLAYGTMGGEGQPQTQAKVFTDYTWRNRSIAEAVAAPRWLLGRTWGDTSTNLKVEQALAANLGTELDRLKHKWQSVDDNNEMMGHAGAILDSETELAAASDPRSDGVALVESVANR